MTESEHHTLVNVAMRESEQCTVNECLRQNQNNICKYCSAESKHYTLVNVAMSDVEKKHVSKCRTDIQNTARW